MTPTIAAPRRPVSISTVLAFVGLVAMAVGWFLPWSTRIDLRGVGPTGPELDRLADPRANAGVPADVAEVAGRLRDNGSATGHDLTVVGSYWNDHRGSHDPTERRALKIGLFTARAAPYLAAFLALLVLLGRLAKPSSPVLGLVLAYSLGMAAFTGLLVLGASDRARRAVLDEPALLGVGAYAIVGGCLASLFGGLFAMRTSTWWKALLLALALVIAAIATVVALVRAA